MAKKSDDGVAVPLKATEQAPSYPDGVSIAVPTDVPESSDSGSKSGQKAATQKEK